MNSLEAMEVLLLVQWEQLVELVQLEVFLESIEELEMDMLTREDMMNSLIHSTSIMEFMMISTTQTSLKSGLVMRLATSKASTLLLFLMEESRMFCIMRMEIMEEL